MLVALNNVIAFLVFSALLPSLHSAARALENDRVPALVPTRWIHSAGAIMFTLGAARTLNLSTLFAPLVLAAVAVFEFLGPPLVGWALRFAGETETRIAPDRPEQR